MLWKSSTTPERSPEQRFEHYERVETVPTGPLIIRAEPADPAIRGSRGNTVRVCMYTAESQKGHARYTRDLLTALTLAGVDRGFTFELITSSDLAEPYRSTPYPIHAILPPLKERSLFPSRVHWAASRLAHYVRRERTFLHWLKSRPDIKLAHFQEYTPWLAPWHFPAIRRPFAACPASGGTPPGRSSPSPSTGASRFWKRIPCAFSAGCWPCNPTRTPRPAKKSCGNSPPRFCPSRTRANSIRPSWSWAASSAPRACRAVTNVRYSASVRRGGWGGNK